MMTRFATLCGLGLLALACFVASGQAADRRPASEARVAPLIRDLGSDDEGVRFKAAKALGKMGPEARAALPTLAKLGSDDSDEDVRRVAKAAFTTILGAAPGGGLVRGGAAARAPAGKAVTLEELVSGSWSEVNLAGQFAMRFDTDGTMSASIPGVVDGLIIGTYTYEGNVLTITYNGVAGVTETYRLTWQKRPNLIVAEQDGALGGRQLWKRAP
jgi:hypothetical protein